MRRIQVEAVIRAPAETVWQVITDLDRYPEWNGFTPRVTLRTCDLRTGAEFDLDCQITDRKLLTGEHEVVLRLDEQRRALCMGTSRARGRPGIVSERWQTCEVLDAGATRFVNWEEFRGPLSPLVQLLYARKLERAFRRYCVDLQGRCQRLLRLERAAIGPDVPDGSGA